MSDNHEGEIPEVPPDTLVLHLDRAPWKLTIGGTANDVGVILAMLNQALRYFERQEYFGAVRDEEQRQRDQDRVSSLLDSVGGARPQ